MAVISEALGLVGKKFAGLVPVRVSTRDLSRHTTKVLSTIKQTGVPAVITYRGVPSFIVAPVEQDELLALVLAASPRLLDDDLTSAEKALEAGDVYTLDNATKR